MNHVQNGYSTITPICKGVIIIFKCNILFLGLLIAILNIFDGFATHYGLMLNKIEELNPIMDVLWVLSPTLFLVVKIMLSYSITALSYLVYRKSGERFKNLFSMCLTGLLIIYLGVFGLHIYWLTLL
ncbi:DUF5658 family protein [Lysinibacillus parviboronicapiens]|uniref:DUF5658 family protein n=1 Tax=Lysinibacillus parviboronicapiens TaxID=436516 RepID=UPI000A6AB798|nr:DUF5658 family protein [Lysinibacillus parviboronicapiens]